MELGREEKLDIILEKLVSLNEGHEESIKAAKSDLVKAIRQTEMRSFKQMEALQWLINLTNFKYSLPPLRGWAASPDLLLALHQKILKMKPALVLEFGSGVSTLVIADALAQNGHGKLVSIESSEYFGGLTKEHLEEQELSEIVDLRVGELKPWVGKHLNDKKAEDPFWYSLDLLKDIKDIDLVLVDGPPASTCEYARYPAMPAVFDKLHYKSEVWLDDTVRHEEKKICEDWKEEFSCSLQYFSMEKGLGVLKL